MFSEIKDLKISRKKKRERKIEQQHLIEVTNMSDQVCLRPVLLLIKHDNQSV